MKKFIMFLITLAVHSSYCISSDDTDIQERKGIKTALSIDGGGIRGLIAAMLLEKIEEKTGKPICELFDYIGGTSTGSLIALGLTVPDENKVSPKPRFRAKDIVEIFSGEDRKRVFPQSWQKWIISGGQYLSPVYDTKEFEDLLVSKFGNSYLKDALTNVVITATELETKNLTVFCKQGKDIGDTIIPGNILMRDAARASTAAPSYFKAGKVIEPILNEKSLNSNNGYQINYYVDGGICCNNPAQIVWHRMQRELNVSLFDDFYLLSLGTGSPKEPGKVGPNAGVMKWLPALPDYFMGGNSKAVHYQLNDLINNSVNQKSNRYLRVQQELTKPIDLAGIDENNMQLMKDAGNSVIEDHLTKICESLKKAGKW